MPFSSVLDAFMAYEDGFGWTGERSAADMDAWWRERMAHADRLALKFARVVVCEVCRLAGTAGCGRVCVRPCACRHGRV